MQLQKMFDMTLQHQEINIFCKNFKLYSWKWKKHARHLLVRLNYKQNSNLNSFHSLFHISIKILHFHETYLHHQTSLFLFIEKNILKKIHVILECIKHSNNNRETLNLHKYVNNDTSAKVASSEGIF